MKFLPKKKGWALPGWVQAYKPGGKLASLTRDLGYNRIKKTTERG